MFGTVETNDVQQFVMQSPGLLMTSLTRKQRPAYSSRVLTCNFLTSRLMCSMSLSRQPAFSTTYTSSPETCSSAWCLFGGGLQVLVGRDSVDVQPSLHVLNVTLPDPQALNGLC